MISKEELPLGTILTVIKVERTNRVFECRTTLRLAPIEFLGKKGMENKIRLEGMIGNEGDSCGDLNKKYYREIEAR